MVEVSYFIPSVVVRRQGEREKVGEFYVFTNLSRLQICIDGGFFFFCD